MPSTTCATTTRTAWSTARGSNSRPGVNRATEPGGIWAYDLDEYPLKLVESFRTIVMRRNPLASRPPSNYRLVYLSTYYEVWQRVQPPATVYAHVRSSETPGAPNAACVEVAAAAHKAGPGAQIAYMPLAASTCSSTAQHVISGAFPKAGGVIIATGAGRAPPAADTGGGAL